MTHGNHRRESENARTSAITSMKREFDKYTRAVAKEDDIANSPKHKRAINLVRGVKSNGLKFDDIVPSGDKERTVDAIKSDACDYLAATGQTV